MHNVPKKSHSNLLPALGHNVGRSLHQPAAKGRVDVVAPLVLTGQLDAVRVKGNNILISVLGQVDREAAGELRLAAGLLVSSWNSSSVSRLRSISNLHTHNTDEILF